ncbi:hypothetical protein Thimo_0782 [Thioflavicoccus mobilis 8321]|uniref:Uncharacterized protein n=1 Tax=Thioflavicoccus mobilis 8321 TaxID=765912 RepID=L0GUF0_9GAMM|nr:hypothetical protein Thimo_0782 [Thioflavicoccus mobilis 8321]
MSGALTRLGALAIGRARNVHTTARLPFAAAPSLRDEREADGPPDVPPSVPQDLHADAPARRPRRGPVGATRDVARASSSGTVPADLDSITEAVTDRPPAMPTELASPMTAAPAVAPVSAGGPSRLDSAPRPSSTGTEVSALTVGEPDPVSVSPAGLASPDGPRGFVPPEPISDSRRPILGPLPAEPRSRPRASGPSEPSVAEVSGTAYSDVPELSPRRAEAAVFAPPSRSPEAPQPLLPVQAGRRSPIAAERGASAAIALEQGSADAATPEVHVHIGRIEVTAVQEPAPARRAPRRAAPTMSLDDYLARRRGGDR